MVTNLRILFIGHNSGTSRHRTEALRRLGHNVEVLDPWSFFPENELVRRVLSKFVYELGSAWIEPFINIQFGHRLSRNQFDLIWNDQCELIGPASAQLISKRADFMVNYNSDDPFGTRDKRRFSLYRKSLSHYNVTVVCREPNIKEAYSNGAVHVFRIHLSADEIAHRQLLLSPQEMGSWASGVAFIGTWMPERGPFLARLLALGVPLTIYGNRWDRAQEWPALRKAWRGPGLLGDDYVKAIQSAKICLGLLSKGNRDLHTKRSVEIPYIGSVLCAERTEEHLNMYEDGIEAVFWSSPEECAEKCFSLLGNDAKRKEIAEAGHERCLQNGYLNEKVLGQIIEKIYEK